MFAKIYQPAKSAMQSGKGNSQWLLEFEPMARQKIEPQMGYTSSTDMQQQIKLKFPSQTSAIEYAKSQGLPYRLIKTNETKQKNISYSENFNYNRKIAWTH